MKISSDFYPTTIYRTYVRWHDDRTLLSSFINTASHDSFRHL